MNRRELLKRVSLMLGGVVSGTVSKAILARVDGRAMIERPVFTAAQRNLAAVLTELIIPETDTPGAIAAGVPHFLELVVSDWYTDTERGIFLAGLEALDRYCQDKHGAEFITCDDHHRVAALEYAEASSSGYKGPTPGFLSKDVDENTPFFNKLKELTVLGYFTSEVGAKQELRYNPMPMSFDGDFDFSEVGRQWSW